MASLVDTNPPPAPDYPPENNFDPSSFVSGITKALQEAGVVNKDGSINVLSIANPWVTLLTWLAKEAFPLVLIGENSIIALAEPFLKLLLEVVIQILKPGTEVLGGLTSVFVKTLVDSLKGGSAKAGARSSFDGAAGAAAAFDNILSPLGMISGQADPAEPGAGYQNSQYTLGAMIQIHLYTFMINVVSNVTGIGALHWINSFDQAVLSAMNVRNMSRIALKPYMDTYIAQPVTRDLNRAHQLNDPGAASIVKTFIRGGLTAEQIRGKMAEKGFSPDVTAQLLLDYAKEMSLVEIAYLVNHGHWTEAQALTYLEQVGWSPAIANLPLGIALLARVQLQHDALADEMVTAAASGRFDVGNMLAVLKELDFTPDEIEAYAVRAATRLEFDRHLTYNQVKELYTFSLVDLAYVQRWLLDEGYDLEDQHLLILLDFTTESDRAARIAELAAVKRVQAQELTEQAAAAATKGDTALAAAKTKLAAKKAARAARLGG